MTEQKARDGLIEAMREIGFTASPTPYHIDFDGHLLVGGKTLEAKLRFNDASFTEAPRLFLPDTTLFSRHVIPHLNERGELCVFDRHRYLFDPYRAAESCLGILQRAASDLEANLGKVAEAEIARELPQHFGGEVVSTQFDQYDGPLVIEDDRSGFEAVFRPADGTHKRIRAFAVSIPTDLSFTAAQHRPTTLGEFLEWVEHWEKGASAKITAQLSKGAKGQLDLICIVCATNGQVGFRLQSSTMPPKQRDIYAALPWSKLAGLKQMRKIPIKRIQGRRCDLAYVLSRNGAQLGPLANLKILLVGCGAIGGYSALALAQLGAGAGKGVLSLVDPDALRASNTVRHILGMNAMGRGKAASLQAMIETHLPGLNTFVVSDRVQSLGHSILSYELIVDVTGEHHVGEWLNRYAMQRDENNELTLFHAWIEGQGAAVRSFFNATPTAGCFRCLHADLESDQGRYWVLKPQAQVETVQPCGDDAYVPYASSAAMAAAALLIAHVSDWAKGRSFRHLLTQQLDFGVTRHVKPASPSRLDACPACGGAN